MQARRLVAATAALVVGTLGLRANLPEARGADPPPAASTASPAPAPPATASAAAAPAAPARAATGYGYGDSTPARSAPAAPRPHRARRTGGPVATLPGFEMLADGGSRLFVQLSKSVDVSERKGTAQAPRAKGAKGKKGAAAPPHPTITYVLKGAQVLHRNNENALVTVHFNTPVSRARLIPVGRDLHFIVDLRADATPTFKVTPAKDNSAILQIDFPKGDFLPNGAAAPAPEPEPTAPVVAPNDNGSGQGGDTGDTSQ